MAERKRGNDGWMEEVVRRLQEAPERDPDAVDAVLREAFRQRPPAPAGSRDAAGAGNGGASRVRSEEGSGWWRWLRTRRLSPLATAGWAAAAVVATLLVTTSGDDAPRSGTAGTVVTGGGAEEARREVVQVHQFVLLAPGARSVAVVGDFNQWDVGATPLVRDGDVWSAEVPLEPGRHVYSFVIDGEEWIPDDDAPLAAGEEFGRPSSVLVFPGAGT